MSLYSLFINNQTHPIHKSAHYFTAYERHFARYVGRAVTFLEFGSNSIGSAIMWKAWLGPLARVIFVTPHQVLQDNHHGQIIQRVGCQEDHVFLDRLLQEFGPFDVVLDDGNHQMTSVTAAFFHLYDKMAPDGTYMIEDMHTAYWPEYGGGRADPRSMIEVFKGMIDDLNADHVRDNMVHATKFTRETLAMTVYDSILVFEKAPYIDKTMLNIGK